MAARRERNIGLDMLRGMSMLYIIGYWHLFNYTDVFPFYSNIITGTFANIVLATFVLISGFFVGIKKLPFTKIAVYSFYKKRFLRIYVLYLLALVVFVLEGRCDWFTALKGALGLSMFFSPAPPTLWFVAMLIVFYLVSPVLLLQQARIGNSILPLEILAVAAALALFPFVSNTLDIRILIYFPSFLIGVNVGAGDEAVWSRRGLGLAFFILGGVVLLASLRYSFLGPFADMVVASAGACLLFFFFRTASVQSKTVCVLVAGLSYASYCMYLFHRPLYDVLIRWYFPAKGFAQLAYLMGFCLPFIFVCSWLIQRGYDRFLRWSQA